MGGFSCSGFVGLFEDAKILEEFKIANSEYLAVDGGGYLTYLAPTKVNLQLAEERWPDVNFLKRVTLNTGFCWKKSNIFVMDAIDIAGKTEMELALIVSRFIEPTSDHEFSNDIPNLLRWFARNSMRPVL